MMEGEGRIDTSPRPEFSRFEANLANGAPLPIFPLAFPDGEKVGVAMVGDYVAQDLVGYLQKRDVSSRSKWLILSTTQSDAIPLDCADVDFNFFTNESGVERYLSSRAGRVPFTTELGDGHYVDPEIFFPDPSVPKRWDIVYAAKWYPTKRTELLVEAARLDPSLRVAIYGWPVPSERKIQRSISYRNEIIESARDLPNVEIYDAGFQKDQLDHYNPDGSVVVGNLSKEEMRDKFFRRARVTIFLSETTEAVNKACTEMLCCDVPMLVAPTNGGLEKLVTPRTGVFIERTPTGILAGIHYALDHQGQFSPRRVFLESYGRENANRRLREIIRTVAANKGVEVNWENMRDYGGDQWTAPEVYTRILNS